MNLKKPCKINTGLKVYSSVIKGIASFGVQTTFVRSTIPGEYGYLSKACNLKCAHCYEEAGKKDEKIK